MQLQLAAGGLAEVLPYPQQVTQPTELLPLLTRMQLRSHVSARPQLQWQMPSLVARVAVSIFKPVLSITRERRLGK